MKSLKGTKTEKNLQEAFAGESMARNKYSYFSGVAKKEGFNQIADIFANTAENEKEHAKLWYKHLHDGKVADTLTNLIDAANGENYEHTEMYARMAKEAKEEGFDDISKSFSLVASIEKEHELRYRELAKNVKDGKVFIKDNEVVWECLNCGRAIKSKNAPHVCDACFHPLSYQRIKDNNF